MIFYSAVITFYKTHLLTIVCIVMSRFLIKIFETVMLIKHKSKAKLHFASEAYFNYYIPMGQYANLAS